MTTNDPVIKSVAKKLKYYIDVRRLEDGWDLTGANQNILEQTNMKARPTLQQYGGQHDRSLKHYFSSNDVRVNLTQMRKRPQSAAPHERSVQHRLTKYMSKYQFQLNGADLPPVSDSERSKSPRCKSSRRSKKSKNELPEYFYIYSDQGRSLRPESQGFGVPFKQPKKKGLKSSGYPALRSVPSHNVSRAEAQRLVNAATKLLIATESVEQSNQSGSGRQTAPRPFETAVSGFPGIQNIDEEEAMLLRKAQQPSKTGGKRPSTAKYTWDIDGRRVTQEQHNKSQDDSFLGRSTRNPRRPHSSYPSSRRSSHRGYRHRSPTPEESTSVSNHSFTTTSTSDHTMEQLPPSSRRRRSPRRSHTSDSDDRPTSGKYRSRTIINVPELKVKEGVSVQETTQTTGQQDEIGIQTETRLIKEYEPQEDEVKQGPWAEYQIYVRTGKNIGSSTRAEVKLVLYGEHGRTKEIELKESKSNKVAFQKGKEDLFMVAAHHVGRLKKIKIGHDRTELSNAWFLDGVSVTDMYGKRIYEFPCKQWLSDHDGDRHLYRVLPADRDRGFVDALNSPRGSKSKSAAHHDTSEDDSAPVVVKHDKNSVKVNQSKGGRKKKAESDDSSSESESDEQEAAVVALKTKSDKGSKSSSGPKVKKNKPKPKGKPSVKPESRTSTGPTFTFRSKNPKKADTRREAEGEQQETLERKNTQEEFIAGYKAGLTAASADQQKKTEEERAKERQMLQGETVHDAARWGHMDRLKELLEHFPDMKNSKDESGWTPLHHASANGQIDVLKWLTTSFVDLNVETRTGYTPIHVAAMNGHVNSMIILSAMGAAITCRTVDKQTPLHLAARGGFLESVKWLVANRACIDAEDTFKRTPIDLAEEYQKQSVADFLKACLRELKNPNSSFSQMHGASQSGDSNVKDVDDDDNFWKDDKASHSAAAGSDDESSISVKRHSPDIKEKKRIYEEQHHKMEETGMSFLDSIRQEAET